MPKTLQIFFLAIICILAAVGNVTSVVHITFNTLRSDLDLLLKDGEDTSTVNIQYSDGAVLHMSLKSKPAARHGKYIRIDGLLDIKLRNGHKEKISGMQYLNGSFSLPQDEEEYLYIVIEENPRVEIKPAQKTIRYVSVKQLTADLNTSRKGYEWKNVYKTFFCPDFQLGTSTNMLIYDWEEGYLRLSKPLKGITLRAEQLIDKFFKDGFEPIHAHGQGSRSRNGPSGSLIYKQSETPVVLFDVWYATGSKSYGSSTGSLGCIDAVRVYDEWSQDVGKNALANTEGAENRGKKIMEKAFEQDMHIAYMRLHDGYQTYKNVVINYANEIVLDVRGGSEGGHRYITAKGTTGSKIANVQAYYDPERLEYSDQVATDETFVPGDNGEESSYLKYIDWGTFKRHLRAIWVAMQGGCVRKKLIYNFSIFYGDSIRVKYDCHKRSIAITDTILVLTDVPSVKRAVISKCTGIRYSPNQKIESSCMDSSITPIAIQQQEPEMFWPNFDETIIIDAGVFTDEMKILKETMIKNEKWRNKPDEGTILLDDNMLFKMKLPEGRARPDSVVVSGNFTQNLPESTTYKTLFYNGDKFSARQNSIGRLDEVFTETNYLPFMYYSEEEYVIASKYLRVKTLQNYLGRVSEEALKRCIYKKMKFSFKLVFHHSFDLQGFYDCSRTVFLIEGKFKALTMTKDANSVRSHRVIDDFIYVEKDKLFIAGSDSLKDVHAISIPKVTELWQASREFFGAPIHIDDNSFLLLSKEV